VSVTYDKRDPDAKAELSPAELWRLYRMELEERVGGLADAPAPPADMTLPRDERAA